MLLPVEFTQCPICHSKETVAQIGCADEPTIPQGTFVALTKEFTPIQQPTSMLAPLIRTIVCSYDVCAKCGHRYCTRAEKMNVPVQVQPPPGKAPRFPFAPR